MIHGSATVLVALFLAGEAPAVEKAVVLPVRGGDGEALRQAVAELPGVTALSLAAAQELHGDLAGCIATSCLVKNGGKAGIDWVVMGHTGRVGKRTVVVLKRMRIPDLRVQRVVEDLEGPAASNDRALPRLVRALWAQPLAAEPERSVAVLYTFHDDDTDPILGELFVAALAAVGSHRVIGQGDIEGVVELMTCVPPCTPTLGNVLDVDRLAALKLARQDGHWVVMSKLLDLRDFRVVRRESAIVPAADIIEVLGRVAEALLR